MIPVTISVSTETLNYAINVTFFSPGCGSSDALLGERASIHE